MDRLPHTPSPWILDGDHIVAEDADIAQVFGPDAEANARLMAAAPDLLRLVREMIEDGCLGDGDRAMELDDRARTLLTGLDNKV